MDPLTPTSRRLIARTRDRWIDISPRGLEADLRQVEAEAVEPYIKALRRILDADTAVVTAPGGADNAEWDALEEAINAADQLLSKRLALVGATKSTLLPCPCECSTGGFCGGCGHAGCGRR